MLKFPLLVFLNACSLLAVDVAVDAATGTSASPQGMSDDAPVARATTTQSKPRPAEPDPDALIAVARDVSPEWAKTLESARAKDPQTFRAAAAKLGKRLSSLAVLRERKPDLYLLRVEELRVQGQLDGLGPIWMSARVGNRKEESEQLESQIRTLAGTLVDLNLRSRAMELAEIDSVMRTMRADLERDARARHETVERMVNACREGSGENVLGGRSPVEPSSVSAPVLPPVSSPAPPSAVPISPSATDPTKSP